MGASGPRRNKLKKNGKFSPYVHFQEPNTKSLSFENKALDQIGSFNINPTGAVTTFVLPAQGLAFNQRVADRCHIVRFDIKWNTFLTTGNNDCNRVILVQEIGLSSAPPTITSVLATADPNSPYVYNVQKLYHILWDETYTLATNASTSIIHRDRECRVAIPQMNFTPATTTTYSGQMYLLAVGNVAVGQVTNYRSRIWFADTD